MSEKFKLSVGGSKLKIEKIEERTDSIGRKIGLRSTKKDSQLIKQSISMKKVGKDPEFKKKQSILSKKRWKDPEYRKKQKKIMQSEEYKDKQRKVQTRTKEEWVEKSKSVHGDRYDYSKSIYLNWNTKIEIVCKKCNISFFQTPNNHTNGSGCPICGRIEGLKNRRIKHGY